jgi:hypothetical protein
MAGQGETLGPTVAGRWYPADSAGLERQLDGLFDDTQSTEAGPTPVSALIAPHAGFVYSGAVAAQGFRHLDEGAFDRVILLGPSHYAAVEGACVVFVEMSIANRRPSCVSRGLYRSPVIPVRSSSFPSRSTQTISDRPAFCTPAR